VLTIKSKEFNVSNAISHGTNDIYWFVLPSVLPQILERFGLKYGAAGGFLTVFLGVIALFSLVFGRLSDRIPRWRIIGAGFLVASVGLLLAGLMGNFFWFVVFILFTAVGVSTYHPAIYAAIDERTVVDRGKTYGVFEFGGALGIFLMLLIYGTLLRVVNWSGLILLTSIPGFFVGFYYLRRHEEIREQHQAVSHDETAAGGGTGVAPGVYLLFFLGSIIRILSITAVVNFIPTYLVKVTGLAGWLASYAAGLVFLGGMLAAPWLGKLVDRRVKPLSMLLVLAGITGPLLFLIGVVKSVWVLSLLLLVLGGSWIGFCAPQNLLLSELSGKMGKGQAFGLMVGLMTLTNAFGPGLFGLLADRVGLAMAVRLFAVPAVVSWVLFLGMARGFRKSMAPVSSGGKAF
jgi:MFS transporter, FSR family, fosmidomycin resistance protein